MENKIRELRKAKHMTMKQLGAILGVAESTISQYETGKRQPDTETLLRIGEFFGVTVGYILGAEGEEKEKPTAMDSELMDLMKLIEGTTPELRQAILTMLRAAENGEK